MHTYAFFRPPPHVFGRTTVRMYATSGQSCSNGLAGYEASKVCCPVGCGQCGGSGCSKLDLGKDCCTKDVKAAGTLCSVSKAAPCNIDTDTMDPGDDSVDGEGTFSGGQQSYGHDLVGDNHATAQRHAGYDYSFMV